MTFREMTVEDLEQVVEIENRLFSDPWTKEGFFTFLTKENTMFFVIEEKEKILAYCSMQTVLDEGDILNVAVSPDRQREGIGYFLVDSMLKMAEMIGIHIVHLDSGLDLAQQALDPLLELAAELGACHKGRQVQQVDLFIL